VRLIAVTDVIIKYDSQKERMAYLKDVIRIITYYK